MFKKTLQLSLLFQNVAIWGITQKNKNRIKILIKNCKNTIFISIFTDKCNEFSNVLIKFWTLKKM